MKSLPSSIASVIQEEQLPLDFHTTVETYYAPLANDIASRSRDSTHPVWVGVNGAQGTGKSTLTRFLALLLEEQFQQRCAWLSIDDLYLGKAARQELARTVHPLLGTRGVPGTHDIPLAKALFSQLANASSGSETSIPVFDKSIDDRLQQSHWRTFKGRPDVIILEGWCVGSTAQAPSELAIPVNDFESQQDPDGVWRRYVNEQLASSYAALFEQIDLLVCIRAPGWDAVYEWRLLQEQKLRARLEASGRDTSGVMSDAQVRNFIQHYERLTRHNLATLPERADYLLEMDRDHSLTGLSGPAIQ